MIVKVRVVPCAKKIKIEHFNEGLKVYLDSQATDGKANKRLIEVLANYYNTRKYRISIVRGQKQRNKRIEVLPVAI